VPSSNGMPDSRDRGALLVSRAARYRELRVDRAIYVLGSLALLAPWALWLQGLWSMPQAALAVDHTTLNAFMRLNLQGFAQGSAGSTATFDLLVATAMGIALFAYDRFAGGLFYSLEGPLSRREVLVAKVVFGSASILLVATVSTLGTVLTAVLSGNAPLAGAVLLRCLFDATGQLSLFATALAMGTAMSTVFSVVATATWILLPSLLQSLLSNLFLVPGKQVVTLVPGGQRVPVTTVRFAAPWIAHLAQVLPNLSPFQPTGSYGWSLVAALALIAWFVAWMVLVLWLAYGWWERAPFERLRDAVFFPFLWNLYYAFLSLLSTLVLGALLTHGTVFGIAWAVIYLALFVAGWFFWRFVVIWRGGRADQPVRA